MCSSVTVVVTLERGARALARRSGIVQQFVRQSSVFILTMHYDTILYSCMYKACSDSFFSFFLFFFLFFFCLWCIIRKKIWMAWLKSVETTYLGIKCLFSFNLLRITYLMTSAVCKWAFHLLITRYYVVRRRCCHTIRSWSKYG